MLESRNDGSYSRSGEHSFGSVDDITINIMTRLPAKTVAACKLTARNFSDLTSEPGFPQMHFNTSTRRLKYIICPYPFDSEDVSRLFVIEGERITEDISLLDFGSNSTQEMNCFPNGLGCIVHEDLIGQKDADIRIFNALTLDNVVLPRGSPSTVMPIVGVAFDPINNGYTAYRFFSDPTERADGKYKCEVYSARTKVWRTIREDVKRPSVGLYHPMCPFYASVAGVLYWFVWVDEDPGTPSSILFVDMDDKFTEIELPKKLDNWSFLIEFESFLAVVHINSTLSVRNLFENPQPNLEVFKRVDGEWISRLKIMMTVDMSEIHCIDSIVASENEIFFIVQMGDYSVAYFTVDCTGKTFPIFDGLDELDDYFPIAFPYAESLLSPSRM